jgi:dTDP-4-amino-4,6-dideoxygalactose transaminase
MKYMLSDLVLGQEEEKAVRRVLKSRWLSMGPETAAFEKDFQKFSGALSVMATSSCTAALHMALLALGIGPGDEVIVPALTFVATANSVLYTGATPVFADITSGSVPLLDPIDLERKMTPRTKAVIVMHYGGYPCDMDPILDICRKKGVWVIEDAAHCAGSKYKGRFCGLLGHLGCFSLFANKNLPAGEGGVLVSNDEKLLSKAQKLRSHGMTSLSWDRAQGHATGYDVTELGFNYRMPELSAAIARAQLKKVTKHNAIRNRLFARYINRLRTDPSLTLPFAETLTDGPGSRHLMPILLKRSEDRPAFQVALKKQGIQCSVHYPPVYSFTYYLSKTEFRSVRLPVTEEFAGRVVTLPFHPALSETDVDHISKIVLQSLPGNG